MLSFFQVVIANGEKAIAVILYDEHVVRTIEKTKKVKEIKLTLTGFAVTNGTIKTNPKTDVEISFEVRRITPQKNMDMKFIREILFLHIDICF